MLPGVEVDGQNRAKPMQGRGSHSAGATAVGLGQTQCKPFLIPLLSGPQATGSKGM